MNDDNDGQSIISVLKNMLDLSNRITGNDKGSSGLHPAVYFYGHSGRHSIPLFMGTMILIRKKAGHNDKNFFKRFTTYRAQLEEYLISHKRLLGLIMQRLNSRDRSERYSEILENIIKYLEEGKTPSEQDLVDMASLEGKILTGQTSSTGQYFSDDTKSQAFISIALEHAPRCAICQGYLDSQKSISYDHKIPRRAGGREHHQIFNLLIPIATNLRNSNLNFLAAKRKKYFFFQDSS